MSQFAPAAPFAGPSIGRLRLSRRRIASVLALMVSLTAGLAYLNGLGQPPTYSVLLVTHDVPRGAVISTADLSPRTVSLPEPLATSATAASEMSEVLGRRTVEKLHAGAPLLNGQVAVPGDQVPGMARVAFPVMSEHAVGGRIVPGDAVRVLVTSDRGKSTAHTSMAIDGALISGVGYTDAGFISPRAQAADAQAGEPQNAALKLAWVEVLVPVDASPLFVQSLSTGDVDVLVLPPADR